MNGIHPSAFPAVSIVKRVEKSIPFLPKNHRFRLLLSAIRRIKCVMYCGGEIINAAVTVPTTQKGILRNPEPMALATTISNIGDAPVEVSEGGILIAVVQPGQAKKLASRGKFAIEAKGFNVPSKAPLGEITGVNLAKLYDYREWPIGGTIHINDTPYTLDGASGTDPELGTYMLETTPPLPALTVGDTIYGAATVRVVVSTHRRCACANGQSYGTDPDLSPIGAHLL